MKYLSFPVVIFVSSGMMNNTLNSSGILQAKALAQPYNDISFGYNGTERVASNFFGLHPDIVDWILIELRDGATPGTIISRRAAFVKQDGTLVDTDGLNTEISFPGITAANYYVAIRHRNHLGIRSAEPLSFGETAVIYDFTTSSSMCYQNQNYTPTVQVGNKWVMRGGNANSNFNVKFNGPSNDQDRIQNIKLGGSLSLVLTNQYGPEDINMDGLIKTNGPGNDQNGLLNIILGGSISIIYNEQL
jgi:hypothetical protein